jgi:hypothetical protein
MWAKGSASDSNRFKFVSVRSVPHANGIAFYGGTSPSVSDADIADIVRNGAGIKISTQFQPLPFAGTARLERITVRRAGSVDLPNAWSFGSLYFTVDDSGIDAPIVVRDVELLDSSHDGVRFSGSHPIRQVELEGVSIDGAGGMGLNISTAGAGAFTDVDVANAAMGAAQISEQFEVTRRGGEGW